MGYYTIQEWANDTKCALEDQVSPTANIFPLSVKPISSRHVGHSSFITSDI